MKSILPVAVLRIGVGLCLLLFASLGASNAATPTAQPPFELRDGDRVLFIGDTFFEREVDYGHIETRLTAAFPDRNITFRNLAWAADTPMGRSRASFDWNKPESEWLKRVKEQVALVKPTVAFLSYGMTAALELTETKPKDQAAKLEKFKRDLGKLMDAIEEVSGQKVRFILLGPTLRERHAGGAVSNLIFGKNISDKDEPIRATEAVLREFSLQRGATFVSLLKVYERVVEDDITPRAVDGFAPNERGNAWASLAIISQLSLEERLNKQEVTGMKLLSSASSDRDNKAGHKALLNAIRKKNELFFHRWRPENWTYLFGFRKHEQGQNAVEIPKFDPLIAEWEARIAKLRDLKHQDPATVKEVQELLADKPHEHRDPNFKEQPVPTFEVADGFEVSLWAESPMLYKPIQMNWDAKGRLWVASSRVYPQIRPGQNAEDAVIVLEDTNGDGKAETSTVFADGLLIPTSVVPDNQGGCYVGASHQLLHFADKNGDGKADEKQIVMSSFGTEDTHHNLHTLRWGYDGHLYMNQSIYTHTHIETPHGVARLNSAGIWRFNPETWRMEIFTKGGCNPWGHHWDQYGNDFFTDGAGGKGIYHAMEGATYFTYADMRREADSTTPGNWPKFASLELIHSPQFPDDWQGDAITCDFRAHRVVRFKLSEAGSTFAGKEMPDLLRSTNVTFRPIDLRMGPDGALYIADWSNPIIQHGEVDFRDPRRDHEHGRIWRVIAKSEIRNPKSETPTAAVRGLTKLSITDLLDRTLSKNGWEQEQARRVAALKLRSKAGEKSSKEIHDWATRQTDSRAILEALWLNESLGTFDDALLEKVVTSSDANFRAAGARYLANNASLPNSINRLAKLVRDDSPRVRVEALRALARIPTAQSAELALSVLDKPMDPTLDYALWLTINDLAEPWIAAIQSGAWQPDGREKQLEFGLKAIQPENASRVLGQILASRPLTRDGTGPWIEIIGAAGTPKELRQLFDQVLNADFGDAASVRALKSLAEASRLRKVKPTGSTTEVGKLQDNPSESVRLEALKLAGEWKELGRYFPKLGELAASPNSSPTMREAAFNTLRQIAGKGAVDTLVGLTAADKDAAIRRQAAAALAAVDLGQAVPRVVEIAKATTDEAGALELWRGVLAVKGAGQSLRDALLEKSLSAATAKAGMRAAREGGRNDVDLVVAFAKAGGLAADTTALTGEVIADLAAKAVASGDPVRGEFVFRRADLACMTCHSIGGAGGKVGPDMTSIGASAPVDYLVESLLLPSAKIKEGYAPVNIETKDAQSLTGTLARETPDEVVLRNTVNVEVSVAKKNIESRQNGAVSLMPSGLLDNLAEQDKLDLIAFLSRLGKPGEFDASKGGVARRWRIYTFTHTDQQNGLGNVIWDAPLGDKMWQPTFALANGKLTRRVLEEASKREFWIGVLNIYAATELQTAKAGPVKLNLDAAASEVWIDGKRVGGAGESVAALSAGTHRVLVQIDPKKIPDAIRLESPDATFLAN
ncbi:MAG: HEAT repeat domain-containing protein [Verrucomicrobia bacterium]|nr:HEAT repeat domain-containing protein [Verrucomicrobiota bacterium]